MKVLLEIDENIIEDEIIIKCNKVNNNIINIQKAISDISSNKPSIIFYKDDKEYYLNIDEILFFETEENITYGHTLNDVYKVKYKLYELLEVLPSNFMKISKSSIINIDKIFSIDYSFTSSSLIQFQKSHKQVYASRLYSKDLRRKLRERRNI